MKPCNVSGHFSKEQERMTRFNLKKSIDVVFRNVVFICSFSLMTYFMRFPPGSNVYLFQSKSPFLTTMQPTLLTISNDTLGFQIVNQSESTNVPFSTQRQFSPYSHEHFHGEEEVTYYAITSSSNECITFAQHHFPSILDSFGGKVVLQGKLKHGLYFMFRFSAHHTLPEPKLKEIPCLQKIEKDPLMATTQSFEEEPQGLNFRENLRSILSKKNIQGMNLDGLDMLDSARDGYYTYDFTGENVIVYVLDSGLDEDHPDLEGRGKVIYEVPGAERHRVGYADCDEVAHGSHVAGIIGGKYTGVAKKVKIHMLRVKGCQRFFSVSSAIAALDFLERNLQRPCLLSLSIGPKNESVSNSLFYQRVRYFVEVLKIPVILSAGNGHPGNAKCDDILTNVPGLITVGSVDTNFNRLSTSNFGPCVDVFAPGDNIWSHSNLTRGLMYRTNKGTSQATPFVAGIGALLMERAGRHLEPEELKELLMYETVDVVKQASLQRGVKRPFVTTPITQRSLDSSKSLKKARKKWKFPNTWFWVAILASCVVCTLLLLGITFCLIRYHFKRKQTKPIKKGQRLRQTL